MRVFASFSWSIFLLVGALSAVVGCSKQPEPAATKTSEKAPPTPSKEPAGQPAKGGSVVWTDPPGWKRDPPANTMRVAQYKLARAPSDTEDAECVVTHFGAGQGGTTEQNLDRWIRQFAADDSTKLEKGTRKVGDLAVSTLEMSGTFKGMGDAGKPNQGMLAAVVEAPSGLWFFKVTGPVASVKQAKPGFDALLGSLGVAK